ARGVTVICHSPLGGPRKFHELSRQSWLHERAKTDGCTLHEWALAALMALNENVVVIPGAKRPETVASCRRAVEVRLPDEAAMVLRRFLAPPKADALTPTLSRGERETSGEVLLLMGLQG